MIEELKPCPCLYCGEDKALDEEEFFIAPASGTGRWSTIKNHVKCLNCGALGPWADTRAGAIEAWNQRKKIWDFVLYREKEEK